MENEILVKAKISPYNQEVRKLLEKTWKRGIGSKLGDIGANLDEMISFLGYFIGFPGCKIEVFSLTNKTF